MTGGRHVGRRGAIAVVQAILVGGVLLSFQGGQFPPLGTGVSADERAALQVQVDQLSSRVADLKRKYSIRADGRSDRGCRGLSRRRSPAAEVRRAAVRRPRTARPSRSRQRTLATGNERAAQLMSGQSPWMTESGVRGFYSRIDGSAQPYILTMPEGYDAAAKRQYRLDIFMHGRDDTVARTAVHDEVDDRLHVEAVWSRRRSVHAAAVRPLHQRQPLRGRSRRARGDRVGREGLSDRSRPDRDGRLLDGRRVGVVLHRALRRSMGGGGARRRVSPRRGCSCAAISRGSRRTPCSRRCGTCTTPPTTR